MNIIYLEVRQKYSAARRIFNSLLGVSSGDETLRLMFDILLEACVRWSTYDTSFRPGYPLSSKRELKCAVFST